MFMAKTLQMFCQTATMQPCRCSMAPVNAPPIAAHLAALAGHRVGGGKTWQQGQVQWITPVIPVLLALPHLPRRHARLHCRSAMRCGVAQVDVIDSCLSMEAAEKLQTLHGAGKTPELQAEAIFRLFPYVLDPPQQNAGMELTRGKDVMCCLPTGSGKTALAVFAAWQALMQGGRLIYTSPLKALSAQKRREFGKIFGLEAVGLVTGDHCIIPDAPLVVMTTEILRNKLYPGKAPGFLEQGMPLMVVLDELHWISDPARGRAWEEIIINSPEWMQFLGLSGSVGGDPQKFCDWMSSIRCRACSLVRSQFRPVPLHFYMMMRSSGEPRRQRCFRLWSEKVDEHVGEDPPEIHPKLQATREQAEPVWCDVAKDSTGGMDRVFALSKTIRRLQRMAWLPALSFALRRRHCQEQAPWNRKGGTGGPGLGHGIGNCRKSALRFPHIFSRWSSHVSVAIVSIMTKASKTMAVATAATAATMAAAPTFLSGAAAPSRSKLAAELANGRLAMMAIIGMFFQDGLTGSAWGDWSLYTASPLRAEEAEEPPKPPPFDPAKQVGAMEPLGYFDPAGFCKVGDKEGFQNLRAAEIKHGRVAMMAALGAVAQHYIKFPGFDSVPAGVGFAALFLLSGAMELAVWTQATRCSAVGSGWQDFYQQNWKRLRRQDPNKEAGDFGDPLGLGQYNEEFRNKARSLNLSLELNNGRFAMWLGEARLALDSLFHEESVAVKCEPRPEYSCCTSCGMPSSHSAFAASLWAFHAWDLLWRLEPRLGWADWDAVAESALEVYRSAWRHWDALDSLQCSMLFLFWSVVLLPVPGTRVVLGDHSPAQVLAGSAVGLCVSTAVWVVTRFLLKNHQHQLDGKKSCGDFRLISHNMAVPIPSLLRRMQNRDLHPQEVQWYLARVTSQIKRLDSSPAPRPSTKKRFEEIQHTLQELLGGAGINGRNEDFSTLSMTGSSSHELSSFRSLQAMTGRTADRSQDLLEGSRGRAPTLQIHLLCFCMPKVEAGSKMDNQETLPVDPNAEDMDETDNQDHEHEGAEEETQDPDPIVETSADEKEDFSDIFECVPEHEVEAAPDHGPSGDVPKTKPKPREVSDAGGSEKQPDVTHPDLASEEEGHETKGTHKD
eukprot:s2503_g4.t1